MHHYIWFKAAIDTFYKNTRAVIIIRNLDGEGGVLPLALDNGFPRRLFFMAAEELGEQSETIFGSKESADALAYAFKNTRKPGRFGHFCADSYFVTALKSTFSKSGFVATAPVRGAPFIDLDKGWADPISKLSSRYRSDFRRMGKKAKSLGNVEVDIVTPSPENVMHYLAEAFDVETRGWKGRAGTSLLKDKKRADFYRRYAVLASERGILRIAFLRIDRKAVATQIAVQSDEGYWLLKIGYDEDYRNCSPGNLLMMETIKYSVDQGLNRYEFLGKAAPWTKKWTTTEHPTIRLRVYPYNFNGIAALILDGSGIVLKRIKERIAAAKKAGA